MSDKKNNIMSDDEYQFPKDEYLQNSATATADSKHHDDDTVSDEKIVKNGGIAHVFQRFPILKNKKIYFFLVFIIVILSGLHMMHHGAQAPVAVQAPVAAPVQPDSQLLNQLDSIKSDQASNQDVISKLQDHLSTLDSKLNSAATANAQLAQSVTMLTAQVQLLAEDVQKNTEKLAAKPKKVAKGKPVFHPKPITYSINAVVPGRAWIVASNGYSYSVSVGDSIAQYGNVKAIDADTGRIYTTSGKIIGYGTNDK